MTPLEETRLKPPTPADRRWLIGGGIAAVLVAIVLAAILIKQVTDDDRPEAAASATSYLQLGCSLADSLAGVPATELLDGSDGPRTTDLHLTAQLLGASARLDPAQAGFGTLGRTLDLHTTANRASDAQSQLRAITGKCGSTERVAVDDAVRADYACVIGARLSGGEVADVAANTDAPLWELRSMNLLASSARSAPYDSTSDPARRALIGGSTANQQEYREGLAALAAACSALED